ncbi:MAG: hypothetical protein M0Z41_02095 [Peptococcaceae bacterium]|nr:hypothetical protein [Peptococcaceae bacterium]
MTGEEFLAALYRHQQGCFYPDAIMGRVMEELSLPPGEAAALLEKCLVEGWLAVPGFRPARYLAPERVHAFPVVLSARALALLRGGS